MFKVKHTIVPVDDISTDEILAFETSEHYGLYCSTIDDFIVVAKEDCTFDMQILEGSHRWDLGEIDQYMQKEYGEMLIGVHTSTSFKLTLLDENDI